MPPFHQSRALDVYFSVNEVCCSASTAVADASLDNCCKSAAVMHVHAVTVKNFAEDV